MELKDWSTDEKEIIFLKGQLSKEREEHKKSDLLSSRIVFFLLLLIVGIMIAINP